MGGEGSLELGCEVEDGACLCVFITAIIITVMIMIIAVYTLAYLSIVWSSPPHPHV